MLPRGVRALLLVLLVACRESSEPDASVDGDGFPYPPPRTDAFAPIGSADTIEIGAWNIENFPDNSNTPAKVADFINSLDVDLFVVEEIASETAWTELLARLRDRTGILSMHRYSPTEYQKIGFIFKTALFTTDKVELLAVENTYEFPRPPLTALFTFDDHVHAPLTFRVIGVHLKAGTATEDGDRRRAAMHFLDANMQTDIANGETNVLVAGDYNEVLTTTVGQTNFEAFLTMPDRYTIQTKTAAQSGEITFVPSLVMLDHITTTIEFDLAGSHVEIPKLHTKPGYVNEVSDHLPVVLVAPLH
jgi:endonuclease/exonuclease/phosphatase family metal-dependent hydrolase